MIGTLGRGDVLSERKTTVQQRRAGQATAGGTSGSQRAVDPLSNLQLSDSLSDPLTGDAGGEAVQMISAQEALADTDLLHMTLLTDFGYRAPSNGRLDPQLAAFTAAMIQYESADFGSAATRLPTEVNRLVDDVRPTIVDVDQFTGYHAYEITFGPLWNDVGQLPALAQVLDQSKIDAIRQDLTSEYNPNRDAMKALVDGVLGEARGAATEAGAPPAAGAVAGPAGRRVASGAFTPWAFVGTASQVWEMAGNMREQMIMAQWSAGRGDGLRSTIHDRVQREVDANCLVMDPGMADFMENYMGMELPEQVMRDSSNSHAMAGWFRMQVEQRLRAMGHAPRRQAVMTADD